MNAVLKIGKASYVAVGVAPRNVDLLYPTVDIWIPNASDAPYSQDRASTWFTAIGRVKPGVTLPQARADLAGVQQMLGRQFPKTDRDLAVRGCAVEAGTCFR